MADKKRIAKNTIALFFRMGILMLISLYTSRVVLQQLGVSDYGTYNLVGGIVVVLSSLTAPLSQGIQRFINYFLGKGELSQLDRVFTSSVVLMAVFGIVILLFGESVGVLVLNKYLVIPYERLFAANWVLQFSLICAVLSMLYVPLQGLILAHEDMSFYAYVSIFEALSKLGVVFLLSISPIDKLIFYSSLHALTSILVLLVYFVFCRRKYKECSLKWHKDKSLYFDLLTFSGWNVLGSTTSILTVQGMQVVLNLFFGTVLNAARGVAIQVSSLVDNTISNIQTAMNPQLTQLYAQNKYDEMKLLLYDNFKWNFFLYWLIGLPLFLKVDFFLELWLGEGFVPDFTSVFIKIIVIRCLLKCFERPLNTVLFATGKVKIPNIFSSSSYIIEIVIAVILFAIGFPPYWCFVVDLFAILGIVIFQMYLTSRMGLFSTFDFLKIVLMPIMLISLISTILTIGVGIIPMPDLVNFIIVCISSVLFSGVCIAFIGLNKKNRMMVVSKVKRFFVR